jgi:hypothetical protein
MAVMGRRAMLCCRGGHIMAMDSTDEERTRRVFIEEIEGALESWRCPTCGAVEVTEMRSGVRKTVEGLLVVLPTFAGGNKGKGTRGKKPHV